MIFTGTLAAAVLASSFLLEGVAAVYNPAQKNNAVVYWGQNAEGTATSQDNLLTTCSNNNTDIVVVSFVTKFKGNQYPIINLSNQCGNLLPNATNPKAKSDILNCADIGVMITKCQSLGKKILLSLGGATYNTTAWKDIAAARSSANEIWHMFGPPENNTFPYRPFGNATVDGFDLDFEFVANAPRTEDFAKQMKGVYLTDPKKRSFMLTASPQCPIPDAALDTALTKVPFDAVFIQFYNNKCAASTYSSKKDQSKSTSFNLGQWQTWATTKSNNKSIRLFVGLLARPVGGTGYVAMTKAQDIVRDSKRWANFAGAAFWDASFLKTNPAYLIGVKSELNKSPVRRDLGEVDAPVVEAREVSEEVPAAAFNKFKRHRHHRRGN